MALMKSIDTEYGVPATYWMIGNVQEDFRGKSQEITMFGFVDEAQRRANKQPLAVGRSVLAGDKYTAGASRAQIYALLKAAESWAGAQDC
jgi:hypothetical protein